jgi:Helicase HerA, central domain
MTSLIEKLIARAWNRLAAPVPQKPPAGNLDLGALVVDERATRSRVSIPQARRPEHVAVLGKTGQGKSFFLRHLASQDVRAGRGFVFFDLHGDTMPFLLRTVVEEEARLHADLSAKLIVIEPGDPECSVGLNVLERRAGDQVFVQIAEFAEVLKQRWHLDHLGARTEELLRSSLHLLGDNGLTLLEIGPLLTNGAFRAACLARSQNQEVSDYFSSRFNQASDAMQAVYRDAILNKVSGFTSDPRFRHLLGQQRSTFSLTAAIDGGCWVILNLDKGRLGEQAATLGSLLLTRLKNDLFARRQRRLFTLYCDEIQNLVAYEGSGLDTLLSEARKFGVSIVSANQFSEQYPPAMRAAILSVATHVLFQLSSADADKMAAALDGGKRLAELLKNLPKRHMVVKSAHERWRQAVVPTVAEPRADCADLYSRVRARWTRRRADIEAEIRSRYRGSGQGSDEVLRGWE